MAGISEGLTRMTTVTFTVDGNDYSNNLLKADIWRKSLSGIGRWEVVLDPMVNDWIGLFRPDDDVSIWIDGTQMMNGYLDDPKPFLSRRGYYTDLYKLSGRDYGMDLAQFYIRKKYGINPATGLQWLIDDIVDDALATAAIQGCEIIFGSPSNAPQYNYEFDRTFLVDGITELANLANYDFYVQDAKVAGNALLHFFPLGSVAEHTNVDLTCVANSLTNNVLLFDMDERSGFGIKNYVEVSAGSVEDHYTDLNASHWGNGGTNTAITDESTVYLNGKGAIRARKTADATILQIELTFPRYNHDVLDLRNESYIRYLAFAHDLDWTGFLGNNVSIGLEDINGNIIAYRRSSWPNPAPNNQGYTTDLQNDEWYEIRVHIGEDVRIGAFWYNSDYWWWDTNVTGTFDWGNVNRIFFSSYINSRTDSYFIIDGLEIPNVEAVGFAEDAGALSSQAFYGMRQLPLYRPDIKNQLELQAFADDQLPRHKDPLEKLWVLADGQTGSRYAAQSLDVRIGNYIPALTKYRINELRHSVVKTSSEGEISGYTFTTEYDLIRHTISTGTQKVSPARVDFANDPVRGTIKKIRLYQGWEARGRYKEFRE